MLVIVYMSLLLIIVIIIIIFLLFNKSDEHFTEGTYKHLYTKDPYVKTNLSSYLYPRCQESVISNAVGDRYCVDRNNKMKLVPLYGSKDWVLTKYATPFYPAFSTSSKPHHVYSPDYFTVYN